MWFDKAKRITEDAAASDWLKQTLIQAINRDPVDAAKDAEVLSTILNLRVKAANRLGDAHEPRRTRSPRNTTGQRSEAE
jgi:hypothetical protein